VHETRLGFSQDSGSKNHHLSVLVLTGLLIDHQPSVISIRMQETVPLPVIKQTFFPHVIFSFFDDPFSRLKFNP
jgi:hypothetical protein